MLSSKLRPFPIFTKPSSKSIFLPTQAKPFSSSSRIKMSNSPTTIEHVVLFKIKSQTPASLITTMLTDLKSLTSLPQVLHISAGPILRTKSPSSPFQFTHLLHSRYGSKDDLATYSTHPQHQKVVKESVLPICEDLLAVDWVNANEGSGEVEVGPGKAMRVTMVKMKEGVGDKVKNEVVKVIGGVERKFDGIESVSYGENFSPGRAKGFEIASVAVFNGVSELAKLDVEEKEKVEGEKGKFREFLESVLVVDYVVPGAAAAQSANLS